MIVVPKMLVLRERIREFHSRSAVPLSFHVSGSLYFARGQSRTERRSESCLKLIIRRHILLCLLKIREQLHQSRSLEHLPIMNEVGIQSQVACRSQNRKPTYDHLGVVQIQHEG